ncbi:MAG: ParA family protein [Planctomycetota bacterium]
MARAFFCIADREERGLGRGAFPLQSPPKTGLIVSMRILAFMNQKGGVGKTTTVVNLGALLAARHGKRVLLVDIDPQANLSDHVGLDPFSLERSVYDVLMRGAPPGEVVRQAFGMDVLPASLDLAGAEVELAGLVARETRLRVALGDFCEAYEYVLVDCPPSLGLLTVSALCLAGEVIVPMQAEYLAMRGLGQLVRTVKLVQKTLNPALHVSGILFCLYSGQTRLAQEVWEEVAAHFPGAVFETVIRRNVRLAESPSHGQPALYYDPHCPGMEDYAALTGEFLRRSGETVPGEAPSEREAPAPAAEAPARPEEERPVEPPARLPSGPGPDAGEATGRGEAAADVMAETKRGSDP